MTQQQPYLNHTNPINTRVLRAKIKEADLYASQCLFDEAREVYNSLIKYLTKSLKSGDLQGKRTVEAIQIVLKVLRTRIEYVDKKAREFYRQKDLEVGRLAEASKRTPEEVFDQGLTLKEAGLFDEAIDAFKQSYELRYRQIESLLAISDCHLAKRFYYKALEILENLISSHSLSAHRLAEIYERIGAIHEEIGDLEKALNAYQQALVLNSELTQSKARIQKLQKKLKHLRPRISIVTRHPVASFAMCMLIALFFMAFLPRVKTVNNVDYFTLEHDPEIQFYNQFKKVFGNDEFFVIAFQKYNLFTKKNLSQLCRLTEELEGFDDTKDITSLANVDDIVGGEDFFEVRPFLEEIPSTPEALRKLKERATSNPLYTPGLISKDGRTTAIVVETLEKPDNPDYRKNLIEKTKSLLAHYRSTLGPFHLAGWTITNVTLSQYMKRDVATFIPIAYLFITLAIWLFFRNLWLTLLAIANITLCVGSTMGLFGLTGITLNNVTSVVPPLVMALALCDVVHIFSHMDREVLAKFGDKRKALAHVLDKVLVPSFLTSLTTAIGFLSLAVSEIPPIRQFACIASAGMVFEFMYSFFLLPPLILLFDPNKVYQDYEAKKGVLNLLRGIRRIVNKHKWVVIITSAALLGVASAYITKLRVETNLIDFFSKKTPLRVSMDFVEKHLGGVDTLDIAIKAKHEDAFKEPRNLKVVEQLEDYIKTLPKVNAAVSIVDFLKDMNQSFHAENPAFYRLPATKNMVSQYLLLYDSDDIEDVINSSYDYARIAVRISEHSSAGQQRLIRQIEEFVDKLDHRGLSIHVTGRAREDVTVIEALVKGQVYSLALAAVTIILIMILVLRSLSLGLTSIAPNIFPIVLNFGIMGAFSIPLDTGTAIISAVALGIVVDDTIHFLSEYKVAREEGFSVAESVNHTILIKGRAILSSSAILCIGFGVVVLSNFSPTVHFGLLTSIIMITACLGDLFLLPSVLLLKKR